METLDILSDAEVMREVRQAEVELDAGDFATLQQVGESLRTAGRLSR